MRVFLDTEFYEFQPSAWRTRWVTDEATGERGPSTGLEPLAGANAIQLISIGAVREDGAEFYAENAEFDWSNVPDDHWLQDNVRPHLYAEQYEYRNEYIHPPSRIAERFHHFATTGPVDPYITISGPIEKPEFWGYFCDYDWVVLCGLYGRMVDLPPEFPRYCLDLKQEMARLGVSRDDLPRHMALHGEEHHALADARWVCDSHEAISRSQIRAN